MGGLARRSWRSWRSNYDQELPPSARTHTFKERSVIPGREGEAGRWRGREGVLRKKHRNMNDQTTESVFAYNGALPASDEISNIFAKHFSGLKSIWKRLLCCLAIIMLSYRSKVMGTRVINDDHKNRFRMTIKRLPSQLCKMMTVSEHKVHVLPYSSKLVKQDYLYLKPWSVSEILMIFWKNLSFVLKYSAKDLTCRWFQTYCIVLIS